MAVSFAFYELSVTYLALSSPHFLGLFKRYFFDLAGATVQSSTGRCSVVTLTLGPGTNVNFALLASIEG